MRTFAFVLIAASVVPCVPRPVAAQTGAQPNLVLTILGGAVTGHSLWTIDRQALCVGALSCTGQYDTLRLTRSISSSLVLGAAATYFPTPNVGFHAELSYLGLPLDSGCEGLFFNPDAEHKNEQLCDDIQSQAAQGGAISIFGGATLRAATRRTVSPYVRGSVGIVALSRSMIEVVGGYVDAGGDFHEQPIIVDAKPRRLSVLFGAAAGFTSPVGTGYQLRFEVRDQVVQLVRLTGPGSASGQNPTARRFFHHFSLVLGLDVVLEKSRGRRY